MAIGTATAIAIGGLALSAGSTAASFAQAGKQKQLQRQAHSDADKAMQEARHKLEANYYDQLSIKKEPYELEREALASQGAQAIQAGVESERGAAATAGRVQMGMNEAQAGIRTAQGKEMSDLEKLSANEQSRLRDVNVQLDLGQVEGAQLAEANAQKLAAASTTQAMQGLTSVVQQGIQLGVPLYFQQKGLDPLTGLPLKSAQMQSAQAAGQSVSPVSSESIRAQPNTQINPLSPYYQNPYIMAGLGAPLNSSQDFRTNPNTQINPFQLNW